MADYDSNRFDILESLSTFQLYSVSPNQWGIHEGACGIFFDL